MIEGIAEGILRAPSLLLLTTSFSAEGERRILSPYHEQHNYQTKSHSILGALWEHGANETGHLDCEGAEAIDKVGASFHKLRFLQLALLLLGDLPQAGFNIISTGGSNEQPLLIA